MSNLIIGNIWAAVGLIFGLCGMDIMSTCTAVICSSIYLASR